MTYVVTEKSAPQNLSLVVIGLGYIGLPTAVAFANQGVQVIGVDANAQRVALVNDGILPFEEPGMPELLKQAVASGKLRAQLETPHGEVYIISVPTPFTGNHELDPCFIDAAVDNILPVLKGGELIVLESTSPVGTTEYIAERIAKARPELQDIQYSHAPERVIPGAIVKELANNDRIIGGMTPEAGERTAQIYKIFVTGNVFVTDARTAEMSKLTENSFRDVNIAFANELSVICDRLHINVWELIELANKHPRVNILQPGPGVGGHCIAVDPWFVVSKTPDLARMIRTAREVNDYKPQWVLDKVDSALSGLKNPTVATLGLAFKADVDDLRESPAMSITKEIKQRHPQTRVIAVEPNLKATPPQLEGTDIEFSTEAQAAIQQADVVVLLVGHREFKEFEASVLTGKRVVDTQGLW